MFGLSKWHQLVEPAVNVNKEQLRSEGFSEKATEAKREWKSCLSKIFWNGSILLWCLELLFMWLACTAVRKLLMCRV